MKKLVTLPGLAHTISYGQLPASPNPWATVQYYLLFLSNMLFLLPERPFFQRFPPIQNSEFQNPDSILGVIKEEKSDQDKRTVIHIILSFVGFIQRILVKTSL